MKGSIPLTELIVLESTEDKWRMLSSNLIKELKTSGLIKLPSGNMVRINLIFTEIIPPENSNGRTSCHVSTNIKGVAGGLANVKEFFNNFLNNSTWTFLGYIEGDNKLAILVIYYECIELAVYTVQLKKQKNEYIFSTDQLN